MRSRATLVAGSTPHDGNTAGTVPPAEVAELGRYMADICAELAAMASSARLAMLSYLLGMAHQEAGRVARESGKAD